MKTRNRVRINKQAEVRGYTDLDTLAEDKLKTVTINTLGLVQRFGMDGHMSLSIKC